MTRINAGASALLALALHLPCAAAQEENLLDVLARKGVLSAEEVEKLKAQQKPATATPTVSTDDGFRIVSADSSWSLQLGTLQQIDVAAYDADGTDYADGAEARRSRLSVGGTFLKSWQYRVEYEFSGSTGVTDAYVAYTARKPFMVTVGQFKQPFGLEALISDKNATFMERGLPFYFLVTRAPGAMLGYSGANWSVNGGVFGEPLTAAPAGDEGYGVVGRLSYAPLAEKTRVVHLGLGAALRQPTADNSSNSTGDKFSTVRFRAKPESNVLAQRLVDTGEIPGVDRYTLVGPEFAVQLGAASLQSEYHLVQVARDGGTAGDVDFSGWYAQLAYMLTGEARPYKGDRGIFDTVKPAHAFGKDGWGAFEVALRLSGIDLSDGDIDGGEQRNATLGVNWYLNPFLRVTANVVKVLELDGGPADGQEPTIYQMRFQLAL